MKRNKTQMLLRWPRRLMRITGTILLGAYLVSVVDPVMANVRKGEQGIRQQQPVELNATEQLALRLGELEEVLDRMQRRIDGRYEFLWQEKLAHSRQSAPPAAATRADLKGQEQELSRLADQIVGLLPQSRVELEQSGAAAGRAVPETALRRSADRMSFEEGAARLALDLSAIRNARDEPAFAAAVKNGYTWLQQHSSRRPQAKLDPDKLAFGSRGESVRAPATDRAGLAGVLGGVTALAGAMDYTAASGGSKAGPVPADLAPTEDVQITAAIRAKAQELGGSPLALFRHVHDTIEFVPSYGSVQGSDYTLQSRRGNAFDQASLLIALLRASGIPARYVYGTIEVPIDQAMNWVGGVTVPSGVLSLLSQGGIPNLGLTQMGVLKSVRLEHVWVEAWVNQLPGSGVRGGTADSWVALDASFKQYEYSDGMGLQDMVPVDAQAIIAHAASTATSNSDEGWTQGMDAAYIASQYEEYRQRLRTYVESQTDTPTFGQVLGAKTIVAASLRGLPSGLPYQRLAAAEPFSVLADHLRWRFRFSVGESSLFGAEPDEELLDRSLPSLAGRSLAFSSAPVTAADEQVLREYLPADIESMEDMPETLPANIVRLAMQFSIDGETVSTGTAYGLGTDVITRKGFYIPGRGWDETDNPFTVGDYQAVGINLHGLAEAHVQKRQAEAEAVREKVLAQQTQGLTPHDLTGTVMQGTALGYFMRNDNIRFIGSGAYQVVSYGFPSYGTVSTDSAVSYLFGSPRIVRPGGVLMDMDRMASITVSRDGSPARRADYDKMAGRSLSIAEHETLEKAFSTATEATVGISAVKMLALASASGQRIYTINETNAAAAIGALTVSPTIKANIADAVAAGKIVQIPQAAMNYADHNNVVGYTVVDADTGAGAYLISTDGADGGSAKPRSRFGMLMLVLAFFALIFALLVLAINVVAGVVLLIIGLLLAGCGFSALTGNGTWFDNYKDVAMFLLALILEAGLPGAVIGVIGLLLAFLFNHAGIGSYCAAQPRPAKKKPDTSALFRRWKLGNAAAKVLVESVAQTWRLARLQSEALVPAAA